MSPRKSEIYADLLWTVTHIPLLHILAEELAFLSILAYVLSWKNCTKRSLRRCGFENNIKVDLK
jgi:hypothetical protein